MDEPPGHGGRALFAKGVLDVLSDDGRHRDPELDAEPKQEEEAPVTTLLSLAAERMGAHLGPMLSRMPDGCRVKRYFVIHANVNSANRLTPTATHTQSAMAIPQFPGSPDTSILRPRSGRSALSRPVAYTMFTT